MGQAGGAGVELEQHRHHLSRRGGVEDQVDAAEAEAADDAGGRLRQPSRPLQVGAAEGGAGAAGAQGQRGSDALQGAHAAPGPAGGGGVDAGSHQGVSGLGPQPRGAGGHVQADGEAVAAAGLRIAPDDSVPALFQARRTPLPAGAELRVQEVLGLRGGGGEVAHPLPLGAVVGLDHDLPGAVQEVAGGEAVARGHQDSRGHLETGVGPPPGEAVLVVGRGRRRSRVDQGAGQAPGPDQVTPCLLRTQGEELRRVQVDRLGKGRLAEPVALGIQPQDAAGPAVGQPVPVDAEDAVEGASGAGVMDAGVGGQGVDLVGDQGGGGEDHGVVPAPPGGKTAQGHRLDADLGSHGLAHEVGHGQVDDAAGVLRVLFEHAAHGRRGPRSQGPVEVLGAGGHPFHPGAAAAVAGTAVRPIRDRGAFGDEILEQDAGLARRQGGPAADAEAVAGPRPGDLEMPVVAAHRCPSRALR